MLMNDEINAARRSQNEHIGLRHSSPDVGVLGTSMKIKSPSTGPPA